MSAPEIDWTNDEKVVRRFMAETFGLSASGGLAQTYDWTAIRAQCSIVEWEAKHRPQVPAVDVEKELYCALKSVQDAVKGGITLCEHSPEMALAGYAISLYEAKGRL